MQLMGDVEEKEMDPGFAKWVSGRLGFGLTILSAAAKLCIAFTVFYGLVCMPGDKVCSVFIVNESFECGLCYHSSLFSNPFSSEYRSRFLISSSIFLSLTEYFV